MTVGIISKNIESLRTEHGYTQERLADVLGVSRITYASIEKGTKDPSASDLEKLAAFYNLPVADLFGTPRNNAKFLQMYFYILRHFPDGVTKTKLAKLLYLADFSFFYRHLASISGVRYVRREYGPVADIFFELTDDLYDKGKIDIRPLDYALLITPTTTTSEYGLLSPEERAHIDKICDLWHDKRTAEIVNFTHEQKPWKSCRDGEYIPYELIIQEDPDHVYAPAF